MASETFWPRDQCTIARRIRVSQTCKKDQITNYISFTCCARIEFNTLGCHGTPGRQTHSEEINHSSEAYSKHVIVRCDQTGGRWSRFGLKPVPRKVKNSEEITQSRITSPGILELNYILWNSLVLLVDNIFRNIHSSEKSSRHICALVLLNTIECANQLFKPRRWL